MPIQDGLEALAHILAEAIQEEGITHGCIDSLTDLTASKLNSETTAVAAVRQGAFSARTGYLDDSAAHADLCRIQRRNRRIKTHS